MSLVYVGQQVIIGIPARNLTDEEVERYGGEKYLLSTGLYKKPPDTKKKASKKDGE